MKDTPQKIKFLLVLLASRFCLTIYKVFVSEGTEHSPVQNYHYTYNLACNGIVRNPKSHHHKHHSKVHIHLPRYTHVCLHVCTHIVRVLSYALLHLLFISPQITVHWIVVWKILLITLTANLTLLKHTYPTECHMFFSMILCVNQGNMFSDH